MNARPRATRLAVMLLAAGTSGALVAPAFAQKAYPVRPIRFVVGNPPGGGQDIIARLLGARLSETFSVPVLIDNRPGAAGNVGAEIVSRAPADGHTLLMIGFANATNVGLFRKLPFDLLKDFVPIALVAESTNFLIAPASSRAGSVGELIAEAKANPGKLNYGSGGNGTVPHLGMELFKRLARVDIVHIPYSGGGQSMAAVLGRQVDMLIVNALAGVPQLKGGKVKALGVTSLKRSAVAPGVPTVAESGLPGFEVISWWGVVAPTGLPPAVLTTLNAAIAQALKHPEIRGQFDAQGIESAAGTPEAFGRFLREEVGKWSRVIRDAGIQPM
jgi:tripartite-type tricarboxylate transporter receptor subunit TctC